MQIYRLDNVVQPYAWGSKTAIADLLGMTSPAREPQAELWMGTHPRGPSVAVTDDQRCPLQQLIDQRPSDILGRDVANRFGNALPYLFKVLAAARPLSIQAHPSRGQAQAGYARENCEAKALDAPNRNYRDDRHKPEIICALSPFWGLNGFRRASEAAALLEPVCPSVLKDAFKALNRPHGNGLKPFFSAMMTLSNDDRRAAALEARNKAMRCADTSSVYRWMVNLAEAYPADMGILSPALLNLICLAPGQAMYLPSGQLHAYLDGVGIELMANSDNVLRGGLTSKHVDVPELLRVVRFVETTVTILEPGPVSPSESVFDCPADEFSLCAIRTTSRQPYVSSLDRSVEILLCTEGQGRIDVNGQESARLSVKKGNSFLIPARLAPYTISGSLTIYKAAVPPAGRTQ